MRPLRASRLTIALTAMALAASVLAPGVARADDDDKKLAEGERARAAALEASSDSGPIEARYPPFSTRFAVLGTGLLITGSLWGVSYGASRGWPENACHITVAGAFDAHGRPCSSGPPGSAQLGIPVAGPWITLGKSGCPSDDPNCLTSSIVMRDIGFLLDGIIQAAGAALFIQGIFMKTDGPKAGGEKKSALSFTVGGVELKPRPITTQSMQGVGVSGVF